MPGKLKGRPPSFELVQALHLVASGCSVNRACFEAGVAGTQVWRVLKSYGGPDVLGSVHRARLALAHYGQAAPPLPRNEGVAYGDPDSDIQDCPVGR